MFPSMPPPGDREPRVAGATREAAAAPGRPAPGVYGSGSRAGHDPAEHGTGGPGAADQGTGDQGPGDQGPGDPGGADQGVGGRTAGHSLGGREHAAREDPDPVEEEEPAPEVRVVPVRPVLSVAIAGFAALLATGLVLGVQSSGPDARTPYAIVIFGVQLLFVLAWCMAIRPPALWTVAGVAVVAAAVADVAAVTDDRAGIVPLLLVAAVGAAAAVIGQTLRSADRERLKDALGGTVLVVFGVVALASLIVLTRRPSGTQTIAVCFAATGLALVVARLTDAVFARPRIAAQVPRGATGIVAGAMLGTLAAAGLGIVMLPFTPARGAVLGLVAAGLAGLVDLAVDYAEAGRGTVGDAPALWVARHMQGPLGAFAFASPVAYVMAHVLF